MIQRPGVYYDADDQGGGASAPEPPTPPTPPEPPALTPEQVSAWLEANSYTAYPANDPRWAKFDAQDQAPPPSGSDDFDFTDPKSIQKIVDERTKELPGKVAADVAKQVMDALGPVLSSVAQSQITQGAREEAKPFVSDVMKELKVTPLQLAQNPTIAKLVNEAAESRAIKAGKIPSSILFPSEPPHGGNGTPAVSEDAQQLRAQVEWFSGRKMTDEEFAPYLAEAGLKDE